VATSKDTVPVASATDIVIASAAVATKLAFTTQPAGAVAGAAFTTQPVVAIQDAGGLTVTTATNAVTLAIKTGTGTSGAVLQTCGPVAAVAGVAMFTGCKIDPAGTGYVLTASATGLASADSTAFNVAAPPAPITNVNFALSSATASATGVTVTVEFQMGAALPAGGKIKVTLPGFAWPATPIAAIVAPSTTTTISAAAFASNTLTITVSTASLSAGLVRLRVSGATNPGAGTIAKAGLTVQTLDSADVVIAGPGASATDLVITSVAGASKLAFIAQPGAAVAGQPFATQPKVAIQDASGNPVTSSTATVTLTKKSGTGTLTCTATSVAAVAGIATFPGCLIDTAGTGFVLTAASSGLTSADSAAFDVAAYAVPTVTSVNPARGPTTGGTRVTILGGFFTGATSVTIGGAAATNVEVISATEIRATTPPGTAGAKDVAVTTPGGTGNGTGLYTFDASGGAKLAFTTQPSAIVVAGRDFPIQPKVTIQDENGRTVTSSTAPVTLSRKSGTGTLSCTANPVNAVAGVATFSGCRIDTAGTDFVMTASATGLTSADSTRIVVTSAERVTATKLVMSMVPATLTAGSRFVVTVSATDASGRVNPDQPGSATLSTADATKLKGVVNASFVGGVATFSELYFTSAGSYTLTASALALTSASNSTITVTPSTTVSRLRFTSQPVAEVSGVAFTTQPVVRAELEDGTVATSFTGTVGLTLGKTAGTTTAVLGGTATAQFVGGVATFTGLKVNGTDGDLYLTATAGALTGYSGAFQVFADATSATTARAREQTTSIKFALKLSMASTLTNELTSQVQSAFCAALGRDTAGCARITVSIVSRDSDTSLKRDDASIDKAGTVPPDAALVRCGEVALDANGEADLPACPIDRPGTYSYVLSVPGQPLMASRPFTVVSSLVGAEPGAPRNLRVEPGDGVAVVSWDPPAATGAGPIIAYDVYGLQDGSPERLLASDSLTSKTLKLANGGVWRFGVRAVNELGTSDMAQSQPVVIGVAPGSPGKPRLSRAQGPSGDQVEVTWDIPPGNPTEFEAISSDGPSCRRGNFGKGFTSASCKVAVESGKTYTFRVIARNAVGQAISPDSDALVVTPGRIDGKCGAMAQQASLVMPTKDLCEAGTAGATIKSVQGAWKWQCEGVQGGSAATCSTTTGAAALGLRTFRAVPASAVLGPKAVGSGCRLQRAGSVAVGLADGPGSGAVMPYGAVGIELADCEGGLADVTISYPVVVEGMAFHALIDGQWFLTPPPGTGLQVKADTVTFTIADNGPWDADPQAGIISFVGGMGYREEWLANLPDSPASVMEKRGATGSR
jgi:hypothetical protein